MTFYQIKILGIPVISFEKHDDSIVSNTGGQFEIDGTVYELDYEEEYDEDAFGFQRPK